MEFKKILDRIEEVNDAIPFIIEKTQELDVWADALLTTNVLNDMEASNLMELSNKIRGAVESLNGK